MKIKKAFTNKKNILSIYYTAGFPNLHDSVKIAKNLQDAGADMVEIGIPFSDPVADGEVVAQSSLKALQNGMNLKTLFLDLKLLRKEVFIPVILMGYLNPILQFGVENFCKKCQECGIDGVIIPDLPLKEYLKEYKKYFAQYDISNIFLISPNTEEKRIKLIDKHSNSFIYVVSNSGVTGAKKNIEKNQIEYFKKIKELKLKNPTLIGFGISNEDTFKLASKYANGAIIGSAFVKLLSENSSSDSIKQFVSSIKK